MISRLPLLQKHVFSISILCGCVFLFVLLNDAFAQELEPRRWAVLPIGANFVGVAYGHSTGSLLFDPSLPVEDANSDINVSGISYSRVFSSFGKQSRLDVLVPYAWGSFTGILQGEFGDVDRAGFTDPSLRYSINFIGGDALAGADFIRYRPATTVGASIQIFAPLGEYREDRLVNLGTNRWTIRPQLGLEHRYGKWSFDLTGSVWLFTDNDDFYLGTKREQEPLYALQSHAIYNFKPGLWLGFGIGIGKGAQTTIDGVDRFDEQINSRGTITLGLPITKYQGIKIYYAGGRTQKVGGSFSRYAIAWSMMWGGGI